MTLDIRKPRCEDWSPAWFRGNWRDWHRGHGCHMDDGQPRSTEGAIEIAAGPQDVPKLSSFEVEKLAVSRRRSRRPR